jgi:hypothetical protein
MFSFAGFEAAEFIAGLVASGSCVLAFRFDMLRIGVRNRILVIPGEQLDLQIKKGKLTGRTSIFVYEATGEVAAKDRSKIILGNLCDKR